MSKENFDTNYQDDRMYQAEEDQRKTSGSDPEQDSEDYSPLSHDDESDNDANRRTLDEEKANEDEDEIE